MSLLNKVFPYNIPKFRRKLILKMDINQLNIEIGVFIRRLRLYSERKNVKVDEKTAELLMDVVMLIDNVIGNSEIIPKTNDDSVNFLFDLNEQHFDLRQYIMCRLCAVSYFELICSNFQSCSNLFIFKGTNRNFQR